MVDPSNREITAKDLYHNEMPVTFNGHTYSMEWMTFMTNKYIHESEEKPFFLYVAWHASHVPSEAPSNYASMYAHSESSDHKMHQAQTTALDNAMKSVVNTLKEAGVWDNTLLIFSSDNGGDYAGGDNGPLRGSKKTLWEGGIRVPAFISGGYLAEDRRGKVMDTIVHVTDWYPTLLAVADIDIAYALSERVTDRTQVIIDNDYSDAGSKKINWLESLAENEIITGLDGVNMWAAIQLNEVTDELRDREILLDLNEVHCEYASCGGVRKGKYKYLRGTNIAMVDSDMVGSAYWYRSMMINEEQNFFDCAVVSSTEYLVATVDFIKNIDCYSTVDGCLYNIEDDPCEYKDIGDEYPVIRQKMKMSLNEYQSEIVPALIGKNYRKLDFDLFDPALVCENTEYWCPFLDYTHGDTFEKYLYEYYVLRSKSVIDEKNETFIYSYISVLLGAILLMLVISVAVVFRVQIYHGCRKIKYSYVSDVDGVSDKYIGVNDRNIHELYERKWWLCNCCNRKTKHENMMAETASLL